MSDELGPIVVEQTFEAPVDRVWRAITRPEEMRLWFFEQIEAFEAIVGFETEFVVEVEGRTFPHQWRVTQVVDGERIVYAWRYGGFPGDSTVTWELSETPAGSLLRLTHAGGETFPQDDPIFSRESGVAGWTYFIQQSLPAFLVMASE